MTFQGLGVGFAKPSVLALMLAQPPAEAKRDGKGQRSQALIPSYS
jgi:hypothetical protein